MENIFKLREKNGYWLTKYYKKFAIFEAPKEISMGEPARKMKKLFESDNLEKAEKYFDELVI